MSLRALIEGEGREFTLQIGGEGVIGYQVRHLIDLAFDVQEARKARDGSPLNDAKLREAEAKLDTATVELDNHYFEDIRRMIAVEKGKK